MRSTTTSAASASSHGAGPQRILGGVVRAFCSVEAAVGGDPADVAAARAARIVAGRPLPQRLDVDRPASEAANRKCSGRAHHERETQMTNKTCALLRTPLRDTSGV